MLKEGGGGGVGSYLPLDGKGSGGGSWNGLKLYGPNPGSRPGPRPGLRGEGGGPESKNCGETGLTGDDNLLPPPAVLLLFLLLLLLSLFFEI